jgi:hypothetical protein
MQGEAAAPDSEQIYNLFGNDKSEVSEAAK